MAADYTDKAPLFYHNRKNPRPYLMGRELALLCIAAIILIVTPWAWGGVVWWATSITLGLSLGMLIIAVGGFRTQVVLSAIWGAILAVIICLIITRVISDTQEILNIISLPAAALFAQLIGVSLIYDDVLSQPTSEKIKKLFKLVPFWCGLALFTYFAIQGINVWGSVTERDLFWRIFKEPYIAWLPNGLSAPFLSDDRDPGGMNAWRVLLTLAGPWMFFCALQVGLSQRRSYKILSWVSVISATIFGAWAFSNQFSQGTILGYSIPSGTQTFGTFINRTHAGVFFYLNVALAMALGFCHFRKDENSSLKGGPHLITIFFAVLLVILGIASYSIAVILILISSLLLIFPLAFLIGMPQKTELKLGPNILLLIMIFGLFFGLATAVNFKNLERKINDKIANMVVKKENDRAPYAKATLAMATAGGVEGKIWYGWGAGSYRWVSPHFQAQQKELTNKEGRLVYRAIYAHNDWLQMLAEWGVVGVIPVFLMVLWFLNLGRKCFCRGRPEIIPLFLIIILLGIHATIDLLFWFTPLLFLAVYIASMTQFLAQESSQSA
jgi:hypothetical protein